VITSVEFDHADIYRDLEHVKQAFRTLVSQIPPDGTIVAAVNQPDVRDVLQAAPCRVVGYGPSEEGTPAWRAASLTAEAAGTAFALQREGLPPLGLRVPLHGGFNVENALAALATLDALGVPVEETAEPLGRFRGVKRRQEIRGEAGGVLVVDDFAHHPTAVRGSVEALRARFPQRRLVAVFEPRTNTSRRSVFQERYAEAFDGARRVVVATPPAGPIYSATGAVSEFFSAERLASDLRARGLDARALDGVDAIVEHLAHSCEPGDVVLVMSNGGFGNIWQRLLDTLRN
jgi:UDP-N-acetylmuramate: L-alanyl-gamma-D-glutamyl-meso-diaminopimelate ligase